MTDYSQAFLTIGVNHRRAARLGGEFSRVYIRLRPYLDRFIGYVLFGTLRLHRFWCGDDDRASHTHPWPFITFPFTSYLEDVYEEGVFKRCRLVNAWRFHYRQPNFEHIVIGRADWKNKPFWTFVITGFANNTWGFYPEPGKFVPFKEWFASLGERP